MGNIEITNVTVVDNTPIKVNNVLINNIQGYTFNHGASIQPQGTYPGQRYNTKNHGRLGAMHQTPGALQKQPCHLPEETL